MPDDIELEAETPPVIDGPDAPVIDGPLVDTPAPLMRDPAEFRIVLKQPNPFIGRWLQFTVPIDLTLGRVNITAASPPTGDHILLEMRKNGKTIFPAMDDKAILPVEPRLALWKNQLYGTRDQFADASFAAGDVLEVEALTVGNEYPGANIVVTFLARLTV